MNLQTIDEKLQEMIRERTRRKVDEVQDLRHFFGATYGIGGIAYASEHTPPINSISVKTKSSMFEGMEHLMNGIAPIKKGSSKGFISLQADACAHIQALEVYLSTPPYGESEVYVVTRDGHYEATREIRTHDGRLASVLRFGRDNVCTEGVLSRVEKIVHELTDGKDVEINLSLYPQSGPPLELVPLKRIERLRY